MTHGKRGQEGVTSLHAGAPDLRSPPWTCIGKYIREPVPKGQDRAEDDQLGRHVEVCSGRGGSGGGGGAVASRLDRSFRRAVGPDIFT